MPKPDPDLYSELVASADAAAHQADPKVQVSAGGLGTAYKPNSLTPPEFLRQAFAASPSLKGHVDQIALQVFPPIKQGPGTDFQQFFADVRAVQAQANDHTPLLVSELGRSTTGPLKLSEADQSDVLIRAVRAIEKMPNMAGVLLFTLADRDELPPDDHERGFGLVRPGPGLLSTTFTPKTAYCAFRREAGNPLADCPGNPPPVADPRLKVKVKPKKAKVKAGKTRRFKVKVKAKNAEKKVHGVRVCLKTRKRGIQLKSKRCKRTKGIAPGKQAKARFKVRLRPNAHRAYKLRFVATAKDAKRGSARAKIKPR
jgi:hypothetical protein